jgi:hypothetical protein
MVATLLVHSDFDLVGLVDVELKRFIGELSSLDAFLRLISTRGRPCGKGLGQVFTVDSDISTRATTIA